MPKQRCLQQTFSAAVVVGPAELAEVRESQQDLQLKRQLNLAVNPCSASQHGSHAHKHKHRFTTLTSATK
jgi:hypothetical protein